MTTTNNDITKALANMGLLMIAMGQPASREQSGYWDQILSPRSTLAVREDAFAMATRGIAAEKRAKLRAALDAINAAFDAHELAQ